MVVLHDSFVCFSTSWHLHAPHGRLLRVGGLFDLAGCEPFLCTRGLNIRPNKSNCQNPAVPEPHGEILSQPLMPDRSHLECDCLPQLFLRVSGVPTAHGVETTLLREVFCRKVQIRKVQRRDCRGGGEESCAISGDHARSTGWVATTALEVEAASAATAKLPAQFCASGSGATEIAQQVLPERETETGGSSACSIPMCSHSVLVCGVAHSLACACITAQAETGRGPGPANPRATNKLRILRIFTQINFTTRHAEQSFGRRLFKPHTPRRFTFVAATGSEI